MVFIALALLVLAKIKNTVLSDPQVDSGPLKPATQGRSHFCRCFSGLVRSRAAACWRTSDRWAGDSSMESLNLAHAHLLLNHLPTIGFGIALCIYIGGFFSKSDSLKKVGLVLFFLRRRHGDTDVHDERKRGGACLVSGAEVSSESSPRKSCGLTKTSHCSHSS